MNLEEMLVKNKTNELGFLTSLITKIPVQTVVNVT